jgi:hypothetical protein
MLNGDNDIPLGVYPVKWVDTLPDEAIIQADERKM